LIQIQSAWDVAIFLLTVTVFVRNPLNRRMRPVEEQAKVRLLDTLMTYHIIIAGLKRNMDFNIHCAVGTH
jgi:hypothetical protein